ncbi:MAG: glycosyltransferase [Halothiobacillaceae bacterium]
MNLEQLLKAASFKPKSLEQPNAWVGHLPFASWVIQEVSPKIFVELGTHSGNSYFSFCQSVLENNLQTKCYAVDTWQGDEHAGIYDDEVFNKVNEHNQVHYSGFSQLLRMTFENAVSYFSDQSIGLLHIDGLHTYEAVKHDFETWLPKLAPGAVVLFHDTDVRERGFGVWQFWAELQSIYPNNIEFIHSHGLGVLQLNDATQINKLDWLAPDCNGKKALLDYFALLGMWQVEHFDRTFHFEPLMQERDRQVAQLNQAVVERDNLINEILSSRSWRVVSLLQKIKPMLSDASRRVWRAMPLKQNQKERIKYILLSNFPWLFRRFSFYKNWESSAHAEVYRGTKGASSNNALYDNWLRNIEPKTIPSNLEIETIINQFNRKPVLSVVLPTYNTSENHLISCLESVLGQSYPYWQLCIADDASTNPRVSEILLDYAKSDQRIRIVLRQQNGHISQASNSALELATGEFVVLLDHDDVLAEHALFYVVKAINDHPQARIFYSDEDKIDEEGRRSNSHFKSDWNPDLFYSQNYVSHLCVYECDLINQVGGFRVGVEGSQDQDLMLRCLPHITAQQIIHIPRVLYHWRMIPGSTAMAFDEKSYTTIAGIKALKDYFEENFPVGVQVEEGKLPNTYRVKWPIPTPAPLVSLLIPTRDRKELIETAVRSIIDKTTYSNYEIIILDNGSVEQKTLDWFAAISQIDKRVRVIKYDHPFNYSAINNFGVKNCQGHLIGLINNDIEVISPEWLTEMVGHACRHEIGCVGAKLYYSNNTIQHGGVILGIGGVAGHSHKHYPFGSYGYFSRLFLTQNLSAVTGACLLVRREVYEMVGGLDEVNLTVAFNDVDFCLKVRQAGFRNLWTPYAELYHHESVSRGHEDTREKQIRFRNEFDFMQTKWGIALQVDPFYNPNLTKDREDFSISTAAPFLG